MSVKFDDLNVEIPKDRPWKFAETIATTEDGTDVKLFGKTVYVVKKLESEISGDEKEKLLSELYELAVKYFGKSFDDERSVSSWHMLDEQNLVYMLFPTAKALVEVWERIKAVEEYLKKEYPTGYAYRELLAKEAPEFLYKLREYTRNVWNRFIKFPKIQYKDGDVQKGLILIPYGPEDTPEDILFETFAKVIVKTDNGAYLEEYIKGLEMLAYRVKDNLRDFLNERPSELSLDDPVYTSTEKGDKRTIEDKISFDNFEQCLLDAFTFSSLQEVYKALEAAGKGLTDREREVIELLAQGFRQADIARQLGITRQAVNGINKVAIKKLKEKSLHIISPA